MLIRIIVDRETALYDIRQKTSIAGELQIEFKFYGQIWEDYQVRTALFSRTSGETVPVMIRDDKVTVPNSMLKPGGFAVSVVGYNAGETLQTNGVQVTLPVSGYFWQGIRKPDEDFFLQFLDQYEVVLRELKFAEDSQIAETQITDDGHLVITYADGTTKDIGAVKGDRGDPGEPGQQGIQGVPGYTPVKGVDYFDGVDGRDGVDGKDGQNGRDGINGLNGYTPVKGVDYFDGAKGDKGDPGTPGYTPIKGVDYFDGEPGRPGTPGEPGYTPVKGVDYNDGFSPVITSSKSGKVTTVTVVDATGTKEFKIYDGADGQGGGGSSYDDTELRGRIETIEGKESGWDAKQEEISDLETIRSGAALGATALQDFTESDPSIFWATYGTTTYAEISAAVSAGKLVLCWYSSRLYVYSGLSTYHYFICKLTTTAVYYVRVSSANAWSNSSATMQTTSNILKTTGTAAESDTNYYSALRTKNAIQAVADAIPTVPTAEISANTAARHSHSNQTVLDGIKSTDITNWNNKSTFSGNYNDLENKPTIPTVPTSEISANTSARHTHSNKSFLDSLTNLKTINGESIVGSGDIKVQGGGNFYINASCETTSEELGNGVTHNYSESVSIDKTYDEILNAYNNGMNLVIIYDDTQIYLEYTWDDGDGDIGFEFHRNDISVERWSGSSLAVGFYYLQIGRDYSTYDLYRQYIPTYNSASGVAF